MAGISAADIRARLTRLARLKLADLPTPLLELPRLSQHLGGPHLLVKREDQTGLACGGNKVREFEYSVAPALERGYDVLLHGAASQSNQSRLTAATAARLGLKAVMVGRRDARAEPVTGNLLLTRLLGAEVHLVESDAERQAVIERLQAAGHKVYNTSTDGYYLRSVAYVDGFLELHDQLQERGLHADGIYLSSGMHTHCGLAVGAAALNADTRIVGMSMSPQDDAAEQGRLAKTANRVAGMLDLPLTFGPGDFETYGSYAGPAYGVPTQWGQEALRLAAQYEGLLLDPVYTGKAFAGLIDHIRQGQWQQDQTVVFVHTGGTPGIFAYAQEVLEA